MEAVSSDGERRGPRRTCRSSVSLAMLAEVLAVLQGLERDINETNEETAAAAAAAAPAAATGAAARRGGPLGGPPFLVQRCKP